MKTITRTVILTVVTSLALVVSSQAEPVELVVNHGFGVSWENGTTWSDGQAARSGHDYEVNSLAGINSSYQIRTPHSNNEQIFPGDSLSLIGTIPNFTQLDGSGQTPRFVLKSANNNPGGPVPIRINDLYVDGACLIPANEVTFELKGNAEIGSGGMQFYTGASDRHLVIDALLSGNGPMIVDMNDAGNILAVTNPLNTWRGDVWVMSGRFSPEYSMTHTDGALYAMGGTFELQDNHHHRYREVHIGSTSLDPGAYDVETLNSFPGGTHFAGEEGIIEVISDASVTITIGALLP